ncbi:hypothetical protein [Paenibacillus sp. N3.4]|uniref:hypothetical protein n=1 Tax=Paenibacillus sp. N3.4 TaxID=2603222 RepID=UPI0028FCA8F2|nr:hypothetical protein [Paenibacillus sp. N3.4]
MEFGKEPAAHFIEHNGKRNSYHKIQYNKHNIITNGIPGDDPADSVENKNLKFCKPIQGLARIPLE